MKNKVVSFIMVIATIWIIASMVDFIVCGQVAWHTSVELQEWNVGLIVYNWIR